MYQITSAMVLPGGLPRQTKITFSSQYSATLLVSPRTGEGIDARAFAAKTAARLRTIRTIRKHSYSLQTIYCHFAIKSFDLEGWVKNIFAFPEGVETSCCHTATSDRGYGWENYPTPTLLPDGWCSIAKTHNGALFEYPSPQPCIFGRSAAWHQTFAVGQYLDYHSTSTLSSAFPFSFIFPIHPTYK